MRDRLVQHKLRWQERKLSIRTILALNVRTLRDEIDPGCRGMSTHRLTFGLPSR